MTNKSSVSKSATKVVDKSQSSQKAPLFLDQLEVDVTGTIVVMIGRIWDVNAITCRYLSTDFVFFDSKSNMIYCFAKSNLAHNFLRMKEGEIYAVKNFVVVPNKDEFRVFKEDMFMLEFDGETTARKVSADPHDYLRYPFRLVYLDKLELTNNKYLIDTAGYVTNVGRTTYTKSGSKTLDFFLGNQRGHSLRVTLWGCLGDVLVEMKTKHVGIFAVVLTGMFVKDYNNKVYLSSSSLRSFVMTMIFPASRELKADSRPASVQPTKAVLAVENSLPREGTLANLLIWARNRQNNTVTFHCKVMIENFRNKKGWNYPSCGYEKCQKGATRQHGKWFCEACNQAVNYPVFRESVEDAASSSLPTLTADEASSSFKSLGKHPTVKTPSKPNEEKKKGLSWKILTKRKWVLQPYTSMDTGLQNKQTVIPSLTELLQHSVLLHSMDILAVPVTYHNIGHPSHQFRNYNATIWYEEREEKSKNAINPTFSLCCQGGKLLLPHFSNAPPPLNHLLSHNDTSTAKFRDQNEVRNQTGAFIDKETSEGVDEQIVASLIQMLDQYSAVAKAFRMARDWDIIVNNKDNSPKRVSELHPSYMALQYPLLFPYGEDGFHDKITYHTNTGARKIKQRYAKMKEYYSYIIQKWLNESSTLLRGGRLFQQYLVDAYTAVEEQRLNSTRNNQDTLRVELYHNLCDAVTQGDTSAVGLSKRIVLPRTFTGSPRYMMQNYQDAMALCRIYDNPNFLITFTSNLKWPEISKMLSYFPGQKSHDRPEIGTRVFKIKLTELLDDLMKKHVFGESRGVVYVIEFQKRGLPHAHILLWLKEHCKCKTLSNIDDVISAELPSLTDDPDAYKTVTDYMLHGPGGKDARNAACTTDRKCVKHFPKQFQAKTFLDEEGYPHYPRRNNKATQTLGGKLAKSGPGYPS
nr:hypothetical protein [Tanacetum cinerariifolium]